MTPPAPQTPTATFWFEFASTYAWLAIQRVEARAAAWGVTLDWRPFLLGPAFRAQGWETSPFLIYPAKGAFMWRDVGRRAEAAGLRLARPAVFPVNSVAAARQALAALETPRGPAFCRAVSMAALGEGRDIADPAALADCARAAGLDPEALAARGGAMRARLRENTEAAMAAGVFGAPSFHARGELFWGEDQMEDALCWAATGRLAPRPS
jgi:2-hydroxychromene-2-carboxylate isomerase